MNTEERKQAARLSDLVYDAAGELRRMERIAYSNLYDSP